MQVVAVPTNQQLHVATYEYKAICSYAGTEPAFYL